MYPRNITLPKDTSFFLFGPRGTGKSTLVRSLYPTALYLDLLDSELYHTLLARPNMLASFIPPHHSDFIIIDEVQRVPELLNEVHRLIESPQQYRFILTGSSARKLRRQGTNLLAGRALTYYLYPLTAEEVTTNFSLAESVRYGCLPAIYRKTDRDKYLHSYVATYLREEIMQEGLVRNLTAFSRFLQMASFSVGSLLNTSAIARDAAVERKVVEHYFGILEDLMLGIRLPVFTRRAKRRLVSHPKFYFFDAGIFQTLRPQGPLDNESEIGGPALESLFLQQILAVNNNLELKYQTSYFRTVNGTEVDFVLYGPNGFYAFEVKNSTNFSLSWLRSVHSFAKEYPAAKLYVLYNGTQTLYQNNITVMPMESALLNLSQIIGAKPSFLPHTSRLPTR